MNQIFDKLGLYDDKGAFKFNYIITGFLVAVSLILWILDRHFPNSNLNINYILIFYILISLILPIFIVKYTKLEKPFVEGGLYALIVPLLTLDIVIFNTVKGLTDSEFFRDIIWLKAYIIFQFMLCGLVTYTLDYYKSKNKSFKQRIKKEKK